MHDLRIIHDRQSEQVMKEYRAAIDEHDLDRAQRIRQANPDLFPQGTTRGGSPS